MPLPGYAIRSSLQFHSDYRGEVHVILVNLSNEPFTVTRGTQIAQLVLSPTVQASIREVSSPEQP
jgi:dUTP pyrophosphatase